MKKDQPRLVISGKRGRMSYMPSLEAAGMKGGGFFRLERTELIKLPYGSELFTLPGRMPVGYDRPNKRFVIVDNACAAAAFVSPGYTVTYNASYAEGDNAKTLPFFAYGAVAFYKGELYVAALKVDKELRQDLRYMPMGKVKRNAVKLEKLFPDNRLIRHLRGCALKYGCPAAKNFFLSRYEAPLPTSPHCNARCAGCISYQPDRACPVTQPRIAFVPSAEEVAETALYHIEKVRDPVVSFGQGCEGEPLLAGGVLKKSIALIRKRTNKGIININTNASKPRLIAELFDFGLDSMRVSLNSAREMFYARYYKPGGYGYRDVMESIKRAKSKKGFVSVNYFVMPGFTDTPEEFAALKKLVSSYKIDMIQWRNLNFDPRRYFEELKISDRKDRLIGVRRVISSMKEAFPGIMMGYFNPSRGRMRRAGLVCGGNRVD